MFSDMDELNPRTLIGLTSNIIVENRSDSRLEFQFFFLLYYFFFKLIKKGNSTDCKPVTYSFDLKAFCTVLSKIIHEYTENKVITTMN